MLIHYSITTLKCQQENLENFWVFSGTERDARGAKGKEKEKSGQGEDSFFEAKANKENEVYPEAIR